MTNRGISSRSCSENVFSKVKPVDESALNKAGLITVRKTKHLLKAQDEAKIRKSYGSIHSVD